METKEQTKELATLQKGEMKFGAITFSGMTELEAFADKIVKSGLTPLKEGKQALAAALMGKELGLELMVSLNNIIPINGKATLGIHLITALLLKAGVVIELVKDYEPCVPFVLKGDDGNPYLSVKAGSDKPTSTFLRKGFADETPKEHEVKAKTVIDYCTVIKMTRQLKQPNREYKEVTMTRSFSRQDAIDANLLDPNDAKSAWYKYTKTQCYNRAVAFCGRAIADDILLGIMETSEMADVSGMKYDIVDEKAIVIEPKEKTENNNRSSSIEEAVIDET